MAPDKLPWRTRSALAAGRAASALSRATGRGEGMVIGGQVILKLAPEAIADLASNRVAALVSATNGKTSTTRLLASALEQTGPVVSQPTGANLSTGIVVALSDADPKAQAVLEGKIQGRGHPQAKVRRRLRWRERKTGEQPSNETRG